jgi:hypothetical protein
MWNIFKANTTGGICKSHDRDEKYIKNLPEKPAEKKSPGSYGYS